MDRLLVGTYSEYTNFCYLRSTFASDLARYVEQKIDINAANSLLERLIIGGVFWLAPIFIFGQIICSAFGLLTPTVANWFLLGMAVYFFGIVCAVVTIFRRIDRVTKEGIAYLRAKDPAGIQRMRSLATKEYPQEKK